MPKSARALCQVLHNRRSIIANRIAVRSNG